MSFEFWIYVAFFVIWLINDRFTQSRISELNERLDDLEIDCIVLRECISDQQSKNDSMDRNLVVLKQLLANDEDAFYAFMKNQC